MSINTTTIQYILQNTHLSPEDISKLMQVSNMTLRRWVKMPPHSPIPPRHHMGIIQCIQCLIGQNRLDPSQTWIQSLLIEYALPTCIKDPLALKPTSLSNTLDVLTLLGDMPQSKELVQKSAPQLRKFKQWGQDWNDYINQLITHCKAPRGSSIRRASIGALCYLLTMIDLVPDYIPIVGFIDDLGMLTVAIKYVTRRQALNQS